MPKRKRWASASNNRASARPSQPARRRSRNNKGSGKKGKGKGKPPTLPNPEGLVLRSAGGKGKPFTGKAVGATPLLIGTDANDFSDDDSWGHWQGPGSAAPVAQSSWSQSWGSQSWGSRGGQQQNPGWHQRSTRGKGQGKGVDYCPPVPQAIAACGVDNSFWVPRQEGERVNCLACRDRYGIHPEPTKHCPIKKAKIHIDREARFEAGTESRPGEAKRTRTRRGGGAAKDRREEAIIQRIEAGLEVDNDSNVGRYLF